MAVEGRCLTVNAEFETPLHYREVRGIAQSIANWTWRHFSPEGFSEFQRRRVLMRWEKESRKADGVNLLRAGLSPADVAAACEVSVRSVRRWRMEAEPDRQTITALKPWEILGVSRRKYYYMIKSWS